MPFSSDPFAKHGNPWWYAMSMTLVGLLALYALAQVTSYRIITTNLNESVEIREVEKLVMPKANAIIPPRTQSAKTRQTPKLQSAASPSTQPMPAKVATPHVEVAELLEGLDTKALLATADNGNGSRTPLERGNDFSQGRMQTHNGDQRSTLNADFASADLHRSRRGSLGNDRLNEARTNIEAGKKSGVSQTARAPVLTSGHVATRGRRSDKDVRAEENSEALIAVRGGSQANGGEAGLNIHDLIVWMRAHPGMIPKLVQYDMEHKSGDLASAVTFMCDGRRFELFLSCNASNLLLRVCLIEGRTFMMLKERGIKRANNFFVMGEVVRTGVRIQSLIASRQTPSEPAQKFYNVFSSWWEGERRRKRS